MAGAEAAEVITMVGPAAEDITMDGLAEDGLADAIGDGDNLKL
jgi:hypothetical protein